jgi:HTH-type transcriptional regulator/antitoxin HipB
MSKSYDNLREDFILNRDEKEYRHAYAEESLDISVGTQIKVLREQRGWRQADLAREAEMPQPSVSRYENVNYSNWSINTLKKLARAFDVCLDVRFRSFGDLVTTVNEFSRATLEVPAFRDDTFFKRTSKLHRARLKRSSAITPAFPNTGQPGTDIQPRQQVQQLGFTFHPGGNIVPFRTFVAPNPTALGESHDSIRNAGKAATPAA